MGEGRGEGKEQGKLGEENSKVLASHTNKGSLPVLRIKNIEWLNGLRRKTKIIDRILNPSTELRVNYSYFRTTFP